MVKIYNYLLMVYVIAKNSEFIAIYEIPTALKPRMYKFNKKKCYKFRCVNSLLIFGFGCGMMRNMFYVSLRYFEHVICIHKIYWNGCKKKLVYIFMPHKDLPNYPWQY